MIRGHRILVLSFLALCALAVLAPQAARADGSRFGRCDVDESLTEGEHMPLLAKALAAGAPVRIVILGSTSAMGRGASSPEKSYGRLLEAALAAALPGRKVTVVEKTAQGRTALTMRDRIAKDVAPLAPSLVIWETGTTDAIQHLDPTDFGEAVDGGLTALHAAGSDILLMTPMFNPHAQGLVNYDEFRDVMLQVAGAHAVAVFRRDAVMRHLVENGNLVMVPGRDRAAMTKTIDGLNACVAQLLARMIASGAAPH